MTQPQITTITPGDILPSGRIRVTIRGQHFQVSDPVPSGEEFAPVRVTFGGVEADQVVPVARHRLEVIAPQYSGTPDSLPAAVDVVVTNLDSSGVAIPGESATAVGAITYRRPDLQQRGKIDAVSRAFMRNLRRNLIDEVASATDPDWSDDPASGLTAIAKLPCILVDGPQVRESYIYRDGHYTEEVNPDAPGEVTVTAPPFTAILTWSIVIVADRKHEAVALLGKAMQFFHRRPYLRVPTSTGSGTEVEVDLYVDDWTPNDRPSDRVFTYETDIRVEPIYMEDDDGYADRGIPVGDVVAQTLPGADAVALETEELE